VTPKLHKCEALRQDEVIDAGSTTTGQPLGGTALEVDRGGARAYDDVVADRTLIPQRLHSGLPAPHRRHLASK
jgi:hypothetical protein